MSTQSTLDELNDLRTAVLSERGDLMQELATIKAQLVRTVHRELFAKLETDRQSVVRQIQETDSKLIKINAARSAALSSAIQTSKKAKAATEAPWLNELVQIRDDYQMFAADGTRSPTMRRMASEIVIKLNPIIRRAMRRPDPLPSEQNNNINT